MESRSGDSDRWQDIESRLERVLDGDADSLLDESLDALRSLSDESEEEIAPEARFDPVDPAEDPNSQFSEVMQNLTRMADDPTLPAHTVSAYPPSPYLGRPWSPTPRYVHPDGAQHTHYVHEPGPGVPRYVHPESRPRPRPSSTRPQARKPRYSKSREPEEESLLPRSDEVLWATVQPDDAVAADDAVPDIDSIFESLVSRSKRSDETDAPPQEEPASFFTEVVTGPTEVVTGPTVPPMIEPSEPIEPVTNESTLDRFASFGARRPELIEVASSPPDTDASADQVDEPSEELTVPLDVEPAVKEGEDAPTTDGSTIEDQDADDLPTSEAERRVAKRFSRRRSATPGSLASAGLLNVEPAVQTPKTTTRPVRPDKTKTDRRVVPAGTTPNLVPKTARPKNAPSGDAFNAPIPTAAKQTPAPPSGPAKAPDLPPPTATRDDAASTSIAGQRNRSRRPNKTVPVPPTVDVEPPKLDDLIRRAEVVGSVDPKTSPPSGLGPSRKVTTPPELDEDRGGEIIVSAPVSAGTPAVKPDKSTRRVRGQNAAQMTDTQPRTSEELATSLEEPRRGFGYVAGLALLLVGLAAVGWVLINNAGDTSPAFQTESLPESLTEIDADVVTLIIERCDEQGVGGTVSNSLAELIFVDLEIRFVAESGVQFHNGTLQSQSIGELGTTEYSFNYVESLVPEELRGFDHRCEVEVTKAATVEG